MGRILVAAKVSQASLLSDCLDGHTITSVDSVERAQALLSQQDFDLVICGVHFDQSRVFDLLQWIRASSRYRHLPFICVRNLRSSRYPVQSVRKALLLIGANDFIDWHELDEQAEDPAGTFRKLIESHLQAVGSTQEVN